MVCFICKLCTEYIYLFFNYDGAGEGKQARISKPGEFLHLLEMTSFCEPDVQNQFGFPQLLACSLEKERALQLNSALPASTFSAKYFY